MRAILILPKNEKELEDLEYRLLEGDFIEAVSCNHSKKSKKV